MLGVSSSAGKLEDSEAMVLKKDFWSINPRHNSELPGSSELSRPSVTNNNLFPSSVRARGEKNTHFSIPNGVAKSNKEMSVCESPSPSPRTPFPFSSRSTIVTAHPWFKWAQLFRVRWDVSVEKCRWDVCGWVGLVSGIRRVGPGETGGGDGDERVATGAVCDRRHRHGPVPDDQGGAGIGSDRVSSRWRRDPIHVNTDDAKRAQPVICRYWTSPEVQLKVCVKKMSKVYPDFDFCRQVLERITVQVRILELSVHQSRRMTRVQCLSIFQSRGQFLFRFISLPIILHSTRIIWRVSCRVITTDKNWYLIMKFQAVLQ